MRSRRTQVAAAMSVTALNVAVAITVNVLTSGWSWLVFVLLAVLSAGWIAIEAWRAVPRRRKDGSPGAPVPPGPGIFVARPELAGPIVRALLTSRSRKVGITTGLAGAGGFGKTTLAAAVCARPDVRAAFDWIDWVTVGQEVRGAALADAINDISERLDGQRPGLTSPEQAGIRLGELLREKGRALLVVDDVWTAGQLRPFLNAARGCTLLVTTRIPDLLPGDAETVEVDQMSRQQARLLLSSGVGGLPEAIADQLLDITGRWPLALGLANGALRRAVRDGADVTATAERLLARLRDRGPAALDVTDAARRDRAVAATLESSLGVLGDQRERVVELAIFPEDTEIPVDLLVRYWQQTAGLPPAECDRLYHELAELSLIIPGGTGLRMHDVIRTYLRHECGPDRLGKLHTALLDAAAALARDGADPVPWWNLPAGAEYLWRSLAYHLDGAGRSAELTALVTTPRWVIRKLVAFGPVAVAEDLAFADTPPARTLRRFLDQQAHLLIPGQPEHAVVNALAHRLPPVAELRELRMATLAEVEGRPRLVPQGDLPDLPHPALIRVLTGHDGWVRECAFTGEPGALVSAAGDGFRVWNPETGELIRLIEDRELGFRSAFALSPDGGLLAGAGAEPEILVWDTRTWEVRARLPARGGEITALCFSGEGTNIVHQTGDRTVHVTEIATGRHLRLVRAEEVLDDAVGLPGGDLLVRYGATLEIWPATQDGRTRLQPTDPLSPRGLAVSGDGRWAAVTGDDGVLLYDLRNPVAPPRLLGHARELRAAVFSPDGGTLATGSVSGRIVLWDLASARPRGAIQAHASEINDLSFAPDSSALASAGDDGTVRLWDPAGTPAGPGCGTATVADRCAFAADGSWLAVASGNTLTIRDPESGEVVDELTESSVFGLAAVGSDRLAVERVDSILVRDAGNWRSCRALRPPSDGYLSEVTTGGALVAATDGDGQILVWDTRTWAPPVVLTAREASVHLGAPRASPARRAVNRLDQRLRRRYRRRIHPFRRVIGRLATPAPLVRLVIAPDSAWIAVAVGAAVHVVDARTWQSTATLSFDEEPEGMRVPSHGDWLVVAAGDRISYWSTRSWTKESELVAPDIVGAAGGDWSPDGSLLATVSPDDQALVRIQHSRDGTCRTELRLDGEAATCKWLSADRLAIVGGRGIYTFDYLR
ncbi:NB-ARC domain-containing protein [Amycolatopsis ruanii]|uniref:NB-ARC domain-containing protein n=1 Tax=Amycolatopsis ruanii TaxID=944491 RepID=UPI0013BEA555|nr:NB-ARC domain-containing protein [Amycolatopsis ruanii]